MLIYSMWDYFVYFAWLFPFNQNKEDKWGDCEKLIVLQSGSLQARDYWSKSSSYAMNAQ